MTAAPTERQGTLAPPGPAGTVVNEFIGAIERRDLDAAVALMTDDVVYDNVPMAAITGRDQVRAILGPFVEGASAVEFVVFRQAESAGLVMNERLDRFEIGGKWLEIPVAGVFEVADGKIALWRDYFDLATFTGQSQK
jgi:limonene-1,2-epoxide hydrolase